MIRLSCKHTIVSVLILISSVSVFAQEWNSARLTMLYGSSIPFNFNSISKIKNGITITPGTRLGISMADSAKVGHVLQGFVLYSRAFNSQTNLRGEAANTLPLNKIRIKAENYLGLGDGITYGFKDLTSDWVPLFTYTKSPWVNLSWNTHQLTITYDCGIPTESGGNGSLIGETPDYYNVEIEFELVPTGPGF